MTVGCHIYKEFTSEQALSPRSSLAFIRAGGGSQRMAARWLNHVMQSDI